MRLFTLAEAQALLPEIKRRFDQIDRARRTMNRLAPGAKLAAEETGGGGMPHGAEYARALTSLMLGVQEVLSYGIEIKDFERGLCDFPSEREGRIIYLCWQRGEDDIEWWHDIDTGFAGRQPL